MPLREYFAIAKLVALLLLIGWAIRLNDLRSRWEHQYRSEHAGRLADRTAYTQAQNDAAQSNRAQVQKIEQQYQRNSEDERQAYLRDLAKLRAGRVSQSGAPAPQRSAGKPNAPQPSAAPGGADGDGLHLSADQYLQAQEIELRLMHLQNWVRELLAIDPNK